MTEDSLKQSLLQRGTGTLDIIEDSNELESGDDSPNKKNENKTQNSTERVGRRSIDELSSSSHEEARPEDVNVEFEDDIEEASSDRDDLDEG